MHKLMQRVGGNSVSVATVSESRDGGRLFYIKKTEIDRWNVHIYTSVATTAAAVGIGKPASKVACIIFTTSAFTLSPTTFTFSHRS